jgi:hypothetical protein
MDVLLQVNRLLSIVLLVIKLAQKIAEVVALGNVTEVALAVAAVDVLLAVLETVPVLV